MFQTFHRTHPPVVCRAVVELRDDLLVAVLGLGPQELKLFGDERESGPVVVGNVHLEAEGEETTAGRKQVDMALN